MVHGRNVSKSNVARSLPASVWPYNLKPPSRSCTYNNTYSNIPVSCLLGHNCVHLYCVCLRAHIYISRIFISARETRTRNTRASSYSSTIVALLFCRSLPTSLSLYLSIYLSIYLFPYIFPVKIFFCPRNAKLPIYVAHRK